MCVSGRVREASKICTYRLAVDDGATRSSLHGLLLLRRGDFRHFLEYGKAEVLCRTITSELQR